MVSSCPLVRVLRAVSPELVSRLFCSEAFDVLGLAGWLSICVECFKNDLAAGFDQESDYPEGCRVAHG